MGIGALVALAVLLFGAFHYLLTGRGRTIHSVAVLPLANASADANTDYLSDGITESLIDSLSQLPNLRVIARSTVFRFKGKDVDPQKVGQELGVEAVLAGRVLARGDTLIVRAELVDVQKGSEIWGSHYSRKVRDVLAVQEDIAKEISEKLRARLTGEEQKRVSKRYTENTEAYQAYLKGRYEWNQRTLESLKKSIQFFEQAVDKDPSYALAYAGLADVYNVGTSYGLLPPTEAFPRAEAAARKALLLDDTLAEAHTSLAMAKADHERDWEGAEQEFKRALELNPGYANAHYFYAFTVLSPRGRHAEAIAEMKRAVELEPLSLIIDTNLGTVLYFARQYDQAMQQFRRTLEIDPNFVTARTRTINAYEQEGMFREAIAEVAKLPPGLLRAREVRTGNAEALAKAYAATGAKGYWEKMLDLEKERAKGSYIPPSDIAQVYARLGDKDQAFKWLERAYQEHDEWVNYIKVEPAFESFRRDSRFQDFVRRLGLSP